MPEVKNLHNPTILMNPVIDIVGRMIKLPHFPTSGNGCTNVRKRLENLHMADQRLPHLGSRLRTLAGDVLNDLAEVA
jgi:hypothetical protein